MDIGTAAIELGIALAGGAFGALAAAVKLGREVERLRQGADSAGKTAESAQSKIKELERKIEEKTEELERKIEDKTEELERKIEEDGKENEKSWRELTYTLGQISMVLSPPEGPPTRPDLPAAPRPRLPSRPR